jgi:hypothetical protein
MESGINRREWLLGAAVAAVQPVPGWIESIEQAQIWSNLDGRGVTWFHPRICRLVSGQLLMTVQSISGSDVYGPVHWSVSGDGGRGWSRPEPIPGMGRRTVDGGLEEGYCDTVPEIHPRTGTVIAMAHNVYYKDNRLARPADQRWPVYTVRGPDGRWTPLRRLEWSHPDATAMYTSGCSQRITLDSGDILVSISMGPTGRQDRGVCTLLCSFNGEKLDAKRHGNILRFSAGRGLLEPSLAALDGIYYMTIRAENGQGFVTRSKDGLQWETMRAWAWDDGSTIEMSTTQQRWLVHSDGLWLVYTRKDASNTDVMRWRAPLFMARMDAQRMCLLRTSERTAVPLEGDGVNDGKGVEHLGNFHTNPVSRDESLISVGTMITGRGYAGTVRLARVRWARPNRLI